MARYSLDLPLCVSAEDDFLKLNDEQKRAYNEVARKLKKEGANIDKKATVPKLLFKTRDIDEMITFFEFAESELKKLGDSISIDFTDDLIAIKLPECPQCGYSGNLSDCPICGIKLTKSVAFDLEGLKKESKKHQT